MLTTIASESVQTCVTSPPYWWLRDYGVEGQLGLEPTPDAYVQKMVQVFREVRRVLKDDGTLWLNLGDSYAGSWGAQSRGDNYSSTTLEGLGDRYLSARQIKAHPKETGTGSLKHTPGLKNKDLCGIPWSVAKALQAPYYMGKIARERDRAWLAGIIDGEGTICGFSHVRKDDGRTRTGAHIFITNSSTVMLDEAQRIWPCSRSEHSRAGMGHLGKLDVFRWIPHGAENKLLLLRELYPYLIAKRKQAVLAYNLLLLVKDAKRLGKSSVHKAVLERRNTLTALLSRANAGQCDVPEWCEEPPSLYEPGYYLRSDIIWSKPNPMPESVTDRPTKSHEYLFLLSKSERYFYDHVAIQEEAMLEHAGRYRYDFSGSKDGQDAAMPNGYTIHPEGKREFSGKRNKRTVWEIATHPYPEAHFATFPPKLIEPCILAGSRPGDTVLDPFAGSGTTLYVAKELNRNFLGIELNPDYINLAEKRLAQEVLPL